MGNKRHVVMLVDDNMTNLSIGKDILKDRYDVFPIPSAEKLFGILEKVTPDVILLDVEMPGMNGYDAIKKLKANPATADVPVIFLTAHSDSGSELEGLTLGAIDYIFKPFSPQLLITRIENHLLIENQKNELKNYNDNLQEMVRKRTEQVVDLQNAVLGSVAELVEFRDEITGDHIGRTQNYLKILVEKILEQRIYQEETSKWNLNFLISSAQLHDVGKINISDAILNKPGKLTPEEFEIMKKHAEIGEQIIEGIMQRTKEQDFLQHAKIYAGTHHEKWDGSGYPRGLKGTDIPLQGRIMAIADVYDALIAARPYKEPMSTEKAGNIILEGKGKHFDPILTDLFESLRDKFAEAAGNNHSDNSPWAPKL